MKFEEVGGEESDGPVGNTFQSIESLSKLPTACYANKLMGQPLMMILCHPLHRLDDDFPFFPDLLIIKGINSSKG